MRWGEWLACVWRVLPDSCASHRLNDSALFEELLLWKWASAKCTYCKDNLTCPSVHTPFGFSSVPHLWPQELGIMHVGPSKI